MKKLTTALFAVALLVGCSSEESEKEVSEKTEQKAPKNDSAAEDVKKGYS